MDFDITKVPARATREHPLYVQRTSVQPTTLVVRRRRKMLVPVILWMCFFAGAYFCISVFVVPWLDNLYNTFRYGYPRTYQADTVVGHDDSPTSPSHFIAVNLNGRIEVVEFAGGNPGKATVYVGPIVGNPSVPVTLTFSDENRDGKVDMIVNVGGSPIVFYNDGKTFRLAHP